MAGKPFAVGAVPGAADLNNMAYIYDRVTSEVDIVNLSTEQTLYSKTITGGHLSTNRILRLTLTGDYLNNSGASKTLTVRVKYGGTTMWGDVSPARASNALRMSFDVFILLGNRNATNSQSLGGVVVFGDPVSGSVAGLGRLDNFSAANDNGSPSPVSGTAAVDSTVDQTFAVTVQHSVAAATTSVRSELAILELL